MPFPTLHQASRRLRKTNAAGGGASYTATVLADSPIGYWRLGEASGTTAADSSGNGRNGTYGNLSQITLGQSGALASDPSATAALFNCFVVGDCLLLPSGLALSAGSAMSIEFWAKMAASPNDGSLLTIGNVDTPSRCQSHVPFSGALYWDYGNSSTGRISTSTTGLGTAWHHYVLVSSGSGNTFQGIYIDGSLAASQASSVGPSAGLTGGYVGGWPNQSLFNRGVTVQEFAVYASVLSAARVAAHKAAA